MAKRKNKVLNQTISTEQTKLFTNLLKTTTQYIQGRNYAPFTAQELQLKLGLPEQHLPIIQEILKALIKDGLLKLKQGRFHYLEQSESVVTGLINMHPRGFGFVKQDGPSDEGDVFIPKHLTLNAVDGDHVEVIINTDVVSDKGPEGKVIAILSRNRTHMAGIITQATEFGEVLAYVPLLGTSQRIVVKPNAQFDLIEGDRVVMKVLEWGSKEEDTECIASHYLGHITDPSCDIAAAIEEYELLNEFSTKALKEADSFGKVVSPADMKERQDLRHLECFTIDPTTAKDFDDALTLSKDKKGDYHLIVHIADVSHYVQEGSAIDLEASNRCNSTYFPGMCLPMLPQALSENLCSLKANVNRLAVSVSMNFNASGDLLSFNIFRSVIKSSSRFTYSDAKEVLDGKKKSKHAPTLHLMVELCKLLKAKRFERGSLEFALPDLVIKVDKQGVPFDTEYVSYDITHQMVEEFMLKANETVAQFLDKQGKNLAYRVHEEPSEENLKDFSMLANAFGFNLPEIPQPKDLQKLFDEALETSYGQFLAVSYIRRMRQAQYSPDNIGHYGLGLTHYCHFTSPIRRYIDLVIHRSLFTDCLDLKKLDGIAKQCSEQERISAKAENNVCLLKKLRLLDKIHQENPYKEYEAVVTRIKHFGFSFEVLDFLLEGFLHVSELDQDYFMFDDQRKQLTGRHTQKVYASGDRISVMLKEVNFIFLESKWGILGVSESRKRNKQKRKWHKKQKARAKHEEQPQEQIKPETIKKTKEKAKPAKVEKPAKTKVKKIEPPILAKTGAKAEKPVKAVKPVAAKKPAPSKAPSRAPEKAEKPVKAVKPVAAKKPAPSKIPARPPAKTEKPVKAVKPIAAKKPTPSKAPARPPAKAEKPVKAVKPVATKKPVPSKVPAKVPAKAEKPVKAPVAAKMPAPSKVPSRLPAKTEKPTKAVKPVAAKKPAPSKAPVKAEKLSKIAITNKSKKAEALHKPLNPPKSKKT